MWQNYETWLVLASLAVCIVALLLWIRDAGDDWLCDRSCHWDVQRQAAAQVKSVASSLRAAGEPQQRQ